MILQSYDIFKRDEGGEPVWVEAVRDLDTAKSRIIELAAEAPGHYAVFSQRSGRMVGSGTVVASPAARRTVEETLESTGRCADSTSSEAETLWK